MAVMLKKVERPRELKWYQAGALLYGDWGTSKAYVIGIAFALTGHASWLFLGLMSILTAMVGFCYMIICPMYPDGGGVYSSVKPRSKLLAFIGAFLLIAGYVVTASLSAVEAFHYFQFDNPEIWAIFSIVAIGVINWVGPSKGSSIAAVIGIIASIAAGILVLFTLPHLPNAQLELPTTGVMRSWSNFVGIVLALSGVEAIANMTGIMVKPVDKTSKKAIWPVLLEVTILTFLLGIAMNTIPGLTNHTEDMLRVLGEHFIGPWYGVFISIVFGFLLLSATNTAIVSLVNIQFTLAKDRELPVQFTKLNRFGMPNIPLYIAVAIPVIVLIIENDVMGLAALYAIGVVGAILLNIGACAVNFKVQFKKRERFLLCAATVVLFFIEATIAFERLGALIFAVSVIGGGLALRYATKTFIPVPTPGIVPSSNVLTLSEAKEIVPLYKSSSLVALKGLNHQVLDEAALRAKALGENTIYLNYVEEVPDSPGEFPLEVEPSRESLELFAKAEESLEKKGITVVPIWQMGSNAGKMIARAARSLEVNTVMVGTTKHSALVHLFRGEIIRQLARNLPKECRLLISG